MDPLTWRCISYWTWGYSRQLCELTRWYKTPCLATFRPRFFSDFDWTSWDGNGRTPNLFGNIWGFPQKWWVSPTWIFFLLKNDQHLGCEMGGFTHHLRKPPIFLTQPSSRPSIMVLPKSSISIGISIIFTIHFGVFPYFWKHPFLDPRPLRFTPLGRVASPTRSLWATPAPGFGWFGEGSMDMNGGHICIHIYIYMYLTHIDVYVYLHIYIYMTYIYSIYVYNICI